MSELWNALKDQTQIVAIRQGKVPGHWHLRTTLRERFETFYAAYPKQAAKGSAWRVWCRLKPTDVVLAAMLSAITRQKTCPQWQADGGKWIPEPKNWLRDERWLDALPASPPSAVAGVSRTARAGYCTAHTPPCQDSREHARRQLNALRVAQGLAPRTWLDGR